MHKIVPRAAVSRVFYLRAFFIQIDCTVSGPPFGLIDPTAIDRFAHPATADKQ
jgi:hypothetical protein